MKYLAALRPKDQLVPIANTMIYQKQVIFDILAIIRPMSRLVCRNCIHIIQHPAGGCPSFKKETGDFHLSTCLSHISLINYLATIVALKAPVEA